MEKDKLVEGEQQYRPGEGCPGKIGVDHCEICFGCQYSEPPLNIKK